MGKTLIAAAREIEPLRGLCRCAPVDKASGVANPHLRDGHRQAFVPKTVSNGGLRAWLTTEVSMTAVRQQGTRQSGE
jgi:hypothetical protein